MISKFLNYIFFIFRVADCPECKMPSTNLARIFGPTLIGYSVSEPEPAVMLNETKHQQRVS